MTGQTIPVDQLWEGLDSRYTEGKQRTIKD